ncbi:PREDICTED: ATP synthase [Prunus dulcis]|uniref:PREDICTED: ATP synthase n=1 Tax=Prunus dulcis TaxID=3755 RepID=A0A5E4GJU5_PRUDU|nr:PREDICTED: ATP synthase [Prunus dulcis]VVA40147.1 PREDICTED: ATP synthase [Prunus dulcis]
MKLGLTFRIIRTCKRKPLPSDLKAIDLDKKHKVFNKIAKSSTLQPHTVNFLNILVAGVAAPGVDSEQVQKLTEAKNVRIKTVIDPSLVAGFTVRYDNYGLKLREEAA